LVVKEVKYCFHENFQTCLWSIGVRVQGC
jgi:hypothetical protein